MGRDHRIADQGGQFGTGHAEVVKQAIVGW
jgi:hypothetical protein